MRSKRGRLSRAGYAAKGPRTRAVTASRFREARSTCCLSVPAAAKLLRVTERTLQNWESDRVRIPYAAYKLMRVLRGHELTDPAWRGFRVVGNTLWTPEGHAFRPGHMTWWSLTCRMADEFRARARARAACEPTRSEIVSSGAAAGPVNRPDPAQYPPPTGVLEPPQPSRPTVTPPPAGVSIVPARCRRTPSSNHGVKNTRNVSGVEHAQSGVASGMNA
ncbi:hypothetical protein GCM10011521_11340 [Arenimonas soli]|uniref:HTH cro/C1-type domain-containing protein n=1 Tax=Arenimonas soli TaxID=2269504 RepID=A0ABQ1HG74_9GAMM|nr:VC1465 family Xer recombination activation factor [Arenimonas soli]GGA74868.1 hypothetical protein GCM10011521_11340 [Arenimonas soli]